MIPSSGARTQAWHAGWTLVCLAFVSCQDAPSSGDSETAPPARDAAAQGALQFDLAPAEARRAHWISLIDRSLESYYSGEYDSARAILESVSEQAAAPADTSTWSTALTWLGLTAWRQSDYDEARRYGSRALELKLAADLVEELPRSYNALGLIAWEQSRLPEAIAWFEESVEAARRVGDEGRVAVGLGNLGLVLSDLGEFAEARAALVGFLEAGRSSGNLQHEANALTNLGRLDLLIGDPNAAIPQLERARDINRSEGWANEEYAIRLLGDTYAALGELGKAHAAYDTALAMAREQEDPSTEAANLEQKAALYLEAGDPDRALTLYTQAREIYTELGMDLETGTTLMGEGLIYLERGDEELATRRVEQARVIHRGVGAPFEELQDILVLAELAQLQGRDRDLRRLIEDAHRLSDEMDIRAARITVALSEARMADARGDAREALDRLDEIDSLLGEADYASEWEAEGLRARARLRLGQLDSAAAAGRRAVASIERVRSNLSSGVLRSSYGAARVQTYADLVTVLLRLGDVGQALETADAARGRALREHFRSVDRRLLAMDRTAQGLADAEAVLRRIERLTAAMQEAFESNMEDDERARAEARDRARRLSEARSEYEALLVSVEESAPRGAMLLGTGATRASELQGALQPGEVLLEYMVTPERLVVFVVSPEEIRLAETDISADELATRVRLARELLRRPATPADGALEVLEGLHRVLVEPAIRAAAIRRASRLVLVPHEALTYLPFGALRDATTGRYLAEQFSLLYLPSAAALTALRVRGPPQDGARSQASALAPFPDQLPGSVAEARAVAARLAGTRELLGGEATEARARAALAGRGVVHLATHGVMNPRNPMFSRIELRGEARESSEFDGRLEVHEILGLSIASPLVFLSGCDTGVGAAWSSRFIQGEDYATLARAFLYAGAVNVIATLWPLHDEGAGAFAEFFYRELEAARPAEALARAQRAMLSSERFRSPFYWAGYRLSGSGI